MEIESIYDDEDRGGLETIKTPNIQSRLDRYCTAISLADSLKNLRKVYLSKALAWLGRIKISPENFAHDYNTILGIIMRVANRRIMDLTDPNLREELDEHCRAINSAESLPELESAHLGDGAGWLKKAAAGKEEYEHNLKKSLDAAALRQMIGLLVKSVGYNSNRKSA